MATTETELAQKTIAPNARFPMYVFALGAALTTSAWGANLIGLSNLLGEVRGPLIGIGLMVMVIGALADLGSDQRYLLSWLKPLVLDWAGLLKFLAIAGQLGLLVVVVRMSYLEHQAFYQNVMLLSLYGFIIHYVLPLRYRLPFFVLLSLAAVFGVFGLADGGWLIGIGVGLIGLCHLPLPFWMRLALLVVAGGALVALRTGAVAAPWSKAIWPILASMFMFRMIIYLYDLKHQKAPVSLTRALAYFFLLPNVAFPLFPVVDYSTFCRTYYDEDQYRIYQRGLQWMLWGVVHLLIYRYINYYWIIGPEKVHDTGTLMQYLVANYLLILRLSGQFHLAVGILHLFGFNLPRIMDRFLLSTSFTEYWRRVNVYWKEFIQKVFYYPAYFRLRPLGNTSKLVLATAWGFVMTWFFHGYQWFWIRGSFRLAVPDVLFWAGIGLFVLLTALYEVKHGRKRSLVKRAASWGEIVGRTLRAAGLFVTMMVLWSLWISPSLAEWVSLWSGVQVSWSGVVATLVGIVVVLGAAMVVYERWPALTAEAGGKGSSFFRLAAPAASAIVLLYVLVQPQFYARLGPQVSHLISDLRTNRLNERDEALLQRGYYENLTNVATFSPELEELYALRPDDWKPLSETKAVRLTNDFLRYELVPLLDGSLKDAPFKTNRWGMRDQEYEQTPPPNTYRIALLGSSVEMGSGVLHEETFEYLLEKRLNREHAGRPYARYEILNFSVGGYRILQHVIVVEKKIPTFKPHALFCVAHANDDGRLFPRSHLSPEHIDPAQFPYQGLRDIMYRAGIRTKMETRKAAQLLEPFREDIMVWAYRQIVEICRQHQILPVLICLPTWPGINDGDRAVPLLRAAEQAGFVVLNLTDVYDSAKGEYLQLAPWDKHPNARGHQLIADGLYAALLKHQDKIPLGLTR